MAIDTKPNGNVRKRNKIKHNEKDGNMNVSKDNGGSENGKNDSPKIINRKSSVISSENENLEKKNTANLNEQIIDSDNDEKSSFHKISLAVVWVLSLTTRLYKIDQPQLIW